LSERERKTAPAIFRSLQFVKAKIGENELTEIEKEATEMLVANKFKVDYLRVVDGKTLEDVSPTTTNKIVLVAAWLGNVRLIDNLVLN
jgi:pantoate--beta-alanine ligase